MRRPLPLALLAALLLALGTGCASRTMPAPPPEVSEATPEGCTLVRFSVPAPGMQRLVKAVAVLPPSYATEPTRRFPVLYALHGYGAPFETWSQMPPLRAALADKPMIVVCFDGDVGSWYLDSPLPQKRWLRPGKEDAKPVASLFTSFFFADLLPAVERRFRTDPQRRMLTGFSMGGFGTFHYLLTRPESFVSASSLSGAFMPIAEPNAKMQARMASLIGPWPEQAERYRAIDLDLRFADAVARGVRLPPLYLACGSDDHYLDKEKKKHYDLLESNRAMAKKLAALGLAAEYVETPGGHDWKYWKGAAADVIAFHWRTLPPATP